jgi:mannosyltransferase
LTTGGAVLTPPQAEPAQRSAATRPKLDDWWWKAALAAVVVVGVAVRFTARSHLWLDEALSVNIAGLPVGQMPEALRHDGSPPLYYLLLHYWTALFGTGTVAVRALSGVFSVAALPLAWHAGRRLGGRGAANAALAILASAPFAVLYATEARMYSLLMLLVLAGGLVLARVLEQPTPLGATLALGFLTAALLFTHYWSMYLLAVVGGLLVVQAWRGRWKDGARWALGAMAAGAVPFLAWTPVLLYQVRHTGAPWGTPGRGLRTILDTLSVLVAGYRDSGPVPILIFEALIALAIFGRAMDRRRVELHFGGREPGRTLAIAVFGTLGLGILVSRLTGQAYVPRYAAIVFPGVVILAGLGAAVILDRRVRTVVLAVVLGLGAIGIEPVVRGERTQAPRVAAALRASSRPGDVVVYCPDQLGPSVSRLLPDGLDQLTFPRAAGPHWIDWVDYQAVNRAAATAPFARMLIERAGPAQDVWLVWSPGYRTLGTKCQRLDRQLAEFRSRQQVVKLSRHIPERMGLVRFSRWS